MALFKTVLLHVILLAAAHLVFTQSTSEEPPQTPTQSPLSPPQGSQGPPQGGQGPPQGGQGPPHGGQGPPQGGQGPPQGGQGSPQGGQGPPQGGQGPPQNGQRPPQGGQGPPQGNQRPPLGGLGVPSFGRNRREVVEQEHDSRIIDPQSKFLGITMTKCNYTREAGSRCTSCTQALTCLPNNFGFASQCRGLFRHCNNGRCSLFQSEACAAAATTAAGVTAAATEATTAG